MCEFITGGGLIAQDLPISLAKEGTLMRDALLRDLEALNQFDITIMLDERLTLSHLTRKSILVKAGDDFNEVFKIALKKVDYVWIIAPETHGILLEINKIAYESNALLLGCGFHATLTGTSKSLSFHVMQAAKIYTLPMLGGEDLMQQKYFDVMSQLDIAKWVAKPIDGAGCEGIRIFENLHDLRIWLKKDNQYQHYFAQPYQQGIAGSLSMLCRDGKGWLLSCNQQHIACDGTTFKLIGLTVNGLQQYWKRFENIAKKIAQTLPDAAGYIGVDVIVDTENDKIFVIEINPRLTTSYVGLHEAIGCNPAKIIIDCLLNENFNMPPIARNQVQVNV